MNEPKDKISKYLLNSMAEIEEEHNILRRIFLERNQLYGLAIQLMNRLDISEVTISKDAFNSSSRSILNMTPNKENFSLEVTITPNFDYKDEESDE